MRRVRLIGALAVCACATVHRSPPSNGVVTGSILETSVLSVEDGSIIRRGRVGLADAHVRLSGTSLSAVADANGNFEIRGVPRGHSTIVVTAAGYDTLRLPALMVSGRDTLRLIATLQPPEAPDAGSDITVLVNPGGAVPRPVAPLVIVDREFRSANPDSTTRLLRALDVAKVEFLSGVQAQQLFGYYASRGAIIVETRRPARHPPGGPAGRRR
jgi:hypothetical protein